MTIEWSDIAIPPASIAFLDDQRFWEAYSGFYFDEKALLEFAKVLGVTAEYIKEKRRKALERHFIIASVHRHAGNDTIN